MYPLIQKNETNEVVYKFWLTKVLKPSLYSYILEHPYDSGQKFADILVSPICK